MLPNRHKFDEIEKYFQGDETTIYENTVLPFLESLTESNLEIWLDFIRYNPQKGKEKLIEVAFDAAKEQPETILQSPPKTTAELKKGNLSPNPNQENNLYSRSKNVGKNLELLRQNVEHSQSNTPLPLVQINNFIRGDNADEGLHGQSEQTIPSSKTNFEAAASKIQTHDDKNNVTVNNNFYLKPSNQSFVRNDKVAPPAHRSEGNQDNHPFKALISTNPTQTDSEMTSRFNPAKLPDDRSSRRAARVILDRKPDQQPDGKPVLVTDNGKSVLVTDEAESKTAEKKPSIKVVGVEHGSDSDRNASVLR